MDKKQRPQYKENPSPVQAYRFRMHIHDAPGPLKVTVSATQHDVVTPACLPVPNDNPGGHLSPVPTHDIPFQLERVSDTEYTGIFHADGMIDEDYHGRGICRWAVIQAQVQLKASGADGETRFIVSLDKDELSSGGAKTVYYWKGGYPRSSLEDFPDYGVTSRKDIREDLRGDLFSVSITAAEAGR
ncbi:hypothetical protein [Pseudoxanthomonas sp. PXM01]|uniref:hypothetical protein n=1 Tax=Pseudoxanthomonas sp. PXM01 TaxID=2769295 RepID=UPI001780AEBD|nr:hypothetical protein [Pseudoxanthomonas sp. PXM01]MBD9468903.1 hypothetical protein [Pseudoxanthomonas sp. PXM01]